MIERKKYQCDYFRYNATYQTSFAKRLWQRPLSCNIALRTTGPRGIFRRFLIERHYGVNLGLVRVPDIGPGLFLSHPYAIDVNAGASIGSNCNLNKGCTIGAENRGKRKGCPTIGDNVWIGANAVVVGKITIGNDVLIAPNAYVNFDVPSHSIVIGNPAKVIARADATVGYINNIADIDAIV